MSFRLPSLHWPHTGLHLLLLPVLFLFSCRQQSLEYVSGSVDNAFALAGKSGKNLLVIAYMRGCESCQGYTEALANDMETRNALANDYLVYKCPLNQVGNEYIAQLAYNVASPTCYVFDRKGTLNQVIMGNRGAKHLVASIVHAKDSVAASSDPFRIGLRGHEYIDFVNTMLDTRRLLLDDAAGKKQLESGITALQPTLFQAPCFYNHYLAARLNDKLGNTEKAGLHAKKALGYDDDFSVFLYGELRKELKFLTGEGGPDDLAYLRFERSSINLGTTPLRSRPRAAFPFKNTGKVPLIVKNVQGSCNCMDITWPQTPVLPGQSGTIGVTYRGDHEGAYSKLLFVTSNAANEQEKITLNGIIN